MTISKEVLLKFVKKANVFIETGTWCGDTTSLAIDFGFKRIFTIELSEKHYQNALVRFSKNKNVVCLSGDSSDVLPILLEKINEPIVFWLDGHWSGGDTAKGILEVPLLKELDAISKSPIKSHTILIDDVRLIGNQLEDGWKNITIQKIKNKLLNINKEYQFYFENGYEKNDIMVAEIK
jgi:hypothetical protein